MKRLEGTRVARYQRPLSQNLGQNWIRRKMTTTYLWGSSFGSALAASCHGTSSLTVLPLATPVGAIFNKKPLIPTAHCHKQVCPQ